MHVGNDGSAFKDAVKFLKHSGVILDVGGIDEDLVGKSRPSV